MMYNRNNIDKNGETGDMTIKSRYPERDKLDLQEEPEVKVAAHSGPKIQVKFLMENC